MSTSRLDATIATSVIAIRRERECRRYCLEQIEGPGAPQRLALIKAEMILGRSSDSDLHLTSQRASRHHALLVRRGTEYVIRDNESHNGVFLNGVKIHSAVLRDGDIVQTADCVFVYRED